MSQSRCTTIGLNVGFLWMLYTTSFICVTTLYGPSLEDWSLGDFPIVWVGCQLHLVALMVACTVGQSVVMSFHLVTGKLQVLVGIIVEVM
jgi:hypothetical protein